MVIFFSSGKTPRQSFLRRFRKTRETASATVAAAAAAAAAAVVIGGAVVLVKIVPATMGKIFALQAYIFVHVN